MKASELRIGNWVFGNRPYQIQLSQLVTLDWYNKTHPKDSYCEPIPLTEEWLVKLGFKKSDEGFMKIKIKGVRNYLEVCVKGKRTILIKTNMFYIDLLHCKYVHKLQNLYFALTGEELK